MACCSKVNRRLPATADVLAATCQFDRHVTTRHATTPPLIRPSSGSVCSMPLLLSQSCPRTASSHSTELGEHSTTVRQHTSRLRGFGALKSSSTTQQGAQALSSRHSTQLDAAISLRWQSGNDSAAEQWQRPAAATAAASGQRQRDPTDPADRPLKINLDLLHVRWPPACAPMA